MLGANTGRMCMNTRSNEENGSESVVKPKRRPGRPKKNERVVTPEVLETIAKLFLRGRTLRQIGAEVGISFQSVAYHIESSIRPQLRENRQRSVGEFLGEVREVFRSAWDQFEKSTLEPIEITTERKGLSNPSGQSGGSSKLTVLERKTRRTRPRGDVQCLKVVMGCLGLEQSVLGFPEEQDIGLRYAGADPETIDDEMVERMAKAIAKRRGILRQYGLGPKE